MKLKANTLQRYSDLYTRVLKEAIDLENMFHNSIDSGIVYGLLRRKCDCIMEGRKETGNYHLA